MRRCLLIYLDTHVIVWLYAGLFKLFVRKLDRWQLLAISVSSFGGWLYGTPTPISLSATTFPLFEEMGEAMPEIESRIKLKKF